MNQQELVHASQFQLTLVLSFFARVDAKASVILAVDTGMAGYLATRIAPLDSATLYQLVVPFLAYLTIGISFWHLYKVAFPNLSGGEQSLIYFNEIGKRTEAKYVDEFIALQESTYTKELLGQAWRNSRILTDKFNHLKWAFIFLALGVVPWTIALAESAMRIPPIRVQ